jgi:hypothetical protein
MDTFLWPPLHSHDFHLVQMAGLCASLHLLPMLLHTEVSAYKLLLINANTTICFYSYSL